MPFSPRPFYRWKSSWLGLFILGFLTWAWWHSCHHPFHITRFQAPRYYQAFHTTGEIVFRCGDGATRTDWWIADIPSGSPPLSRVKANWDRDSSTYLSIPYPAILTLSALGLATFILWRTRRWKRLADHTAEP